MLLRERGFQRGVELGPYPLEALGTDERVRELESRRDPRQPYAPQPTATPLGATAKHYSKIFLASLRPAATRPGALLDDPAARSRELKAAAYYLDAAHVGICAIPGNAWLASRDEACAAHSHALVIWAEFGREIEPDNAASQWIEGAQPDIAQMRADEIGVSLTGFIRALGFSAALHTPAASQVDADMLAVLAGIGQRRGQAVHSPFFAGRYAWSLITTDYRLLPDQPLATDARIGALRYWWGAGGAVSGRERKRQARRASHLGHYPMERIKRVDRPTTLILDDEVPRVPKRAEFFFRAASGDLGSKAKREVQRFAFKHPVTDGMMKPLRAMVPHQDGPTAPVADPAMSDAAANTLAIKALSHHLGADITGICEIPHYAWYSHGPDGRPIDAKHRFAVVMLIDQGFDTMEGASGDDWISGCQSMRGYIRGAEIAGVMAEFLRSKGYDSRAQTNADSHVLQIPLVLWAGLGELSRIGELVLNPFVGPRIKSVVLTTNLPLIPDRPIDFGLQTFCSQCLKCARECPVNAISFGDKVMFNGYEIWKPDVERCTRYRVTNPKGSACGRCMKTCPLNKVVTADGALTHRLGSWLGIHARWLKPLLVPVAVYLDDKLGYGRRNPVKRWWSDLEIVDGVVSAPQHGTNERDLDPGADTSGRKSPIGYYHASDNPAADASEPVAANHKQAIERAALLETVAAAKLRRRAGGPAPSHYRPPPIIASDRT